MTKGVKYADLSFDAQYQADWDLASNYKKVAELTGRKLNKAHDFLRKNDSLRFTKKGKLIK